jgi:hypothetical protein
MNSVDGQDNVNFFAHSFTNVLPAPASLKAKMGAYFFEKGMKSLPAADSNPGHLTVDHVASVDNKGCAVANASTPYKILFQPDSEVQGHYRNLMDEYVLKYAGFGGIVKEDIDFRKVFIPENKESDRIFRPGQTLFNVWGRAEKVATDGQTTSDAEDASPASVGYKKIGAVVLDSYFVASDFGDRQLHFPHHTKLKAN